MRGQKLRRRRDHPLPIARTNLLADERDRAARAQLLPVPVRTAREARSGPKSSMLSMDRRSARRVRARLTRLLMVPTAQPQIAAASSYENPDAPTRINASR